MKNKRAVAHKSTYRRRSFRRVAATCHAPARFHGTCARVHLRVHYRRAARAVGVKAAYRYARVARRDCSLPPNVSATMNGREWRADVRAREDE